LSWRRATTGGASWTVAAVLLLVSFSYTAVVVGPASPLRDDWEPIALREVELEVRSLLSQGLDASLTRAIEVAAAEEDIDLSGALDAYLVQWLTPRFPSEVGGWRVELVEATASMVAIGSLGGAEEGVKDARAPVARARVSITGPSRDWSGPVMLEVRTQGPHGTTNVAVARVGSLLQSLSDPTGPVSYQARHGLWEGSQGLALSGVRDIDSIITREAVEKALAAAIESTLEGRPPPGPRPPAIDLGGLVRQSVEGAIERNLLWLDDYLFLGQGLSGLLSKMDGGPGPAFGLSGQDGVWELEEALRGAAADAVLVCIEAAIGELPVVGPAGSLSEALEVAMDALDGLHDRLDIVLADDDSMRSLGMELAKRALEGLMDLVEAVGPLGGLGGAVLEGLLEGLLQGGGGSDRLVDHVIWAVSSASVVLAGLGIACAEDALRAMAIQGSQVDLAGLTAEGMHPLTDTPANVGAIVRDLEVAKEWTGTQECTPWSVPSPSDGSREGVGADGAVGEASVGSLPYLATCVVSVTGTADVTAVVEGSGGRSLDATWEAPIDLVLEMHLVTGWALEGVAYAPSTTLWGDIADAARALWEGFTDAVLWLAHRLWDAGEWVLSQVRSLVRELVQNVLAESAYTLSRHLWRIGESLVRKQLNDALNGTWDLLEDLIGDELRERFTWEMEVMGCDVTVSFDPFLHQLGLVVERGSITVELALRRLCDPHPPFRARPVEGYHWGVFGEARLDLGGRGAVLYLDPLTLEHGSVMTLAARWGGDGGEPTNELAIEALEARRVSKRHDVRLSELVGGLGILSLAGFGPVVDAGLVLHGDLGDPDEALELAVKAVKDAWFASVRGWRTGELLEAMSTGPEAGMFLEVLFRELHYAMVERSHALVSELEAFVEVDPPSPGWPSIRVSLVLSRPLELLLPLQAWIARALPGLVGEAASGSIGGAARGLASAVAERVLVRFELVWGVDLPEWLFDVGASEAPREVGLVVRGQVNLAALTALVGRDWGRWEASLEVLLRGVPGALLAVVPGMGSPEWKWAEVVLVRVVLRDISQPRLRIHQVLYDASGRDSDLEFVELVNVGTRIIDLGDFVIEDGDGSHRLRGHMPLLPGDHLLVVRNRTAGWRTWRIAPDAWGMGLRLANDGDVVRLVTPEGVCLDQVAWEGYLPGWEGLEATEGMALVRIDGDLRPSEAAAWTVAEPAPRRSGPG
jgi:hypothetical protein